MSSSPSPAPSEMDSVSRSGGTRSPQLADIVFAVVGLSGAGKSSFISHCIGYPVADKGLALHQCKQIGPDNVWLLDTPGLCNNDEDNFQALRHMVRWLDDDGMTLRGIIYLQDIRTTNLEDIRTMRRTIDLLRDLCSADIIIVTSMWDKVDATLGALSERILDDARIGGFPVHRFDNTQTSALQLAQLLADDVATSTANNRDF